MSRPALVIGLGGTGQWVLTYLKKDLLEIGGGKMPPGVKLLAFDTTSQTTARTGHEGKRTQADTVSAGSVKLTDGTEFIPIGDNVSTLVTEIAAGKHSHLQWYPAKSFLAKLPPSAFNTKEGSGQIRQMGRLSVFRDLSSSTTSEILSRLRAAIQDLQTQVSRDSQLEIIIIGSLAGGTGAGMLVDTAILVRAQATRLVQNNFIIRGFFVLPRAFTASSIGEGRDMRARAFATWRELDRFMIVSERFGLRQINYHEQNRDLRIPIDRRAYDVSYMIDPARQAVNSLDNIKAEEGLYPAVSQVISAILDDKAGKAYTEFVSTNLAGKLAQLPRHPYHSAIGSYTLKVPVYYAQEKFSHQLALDALREFLVPELNDKGRVVRVSESHNREVPQGQAGKSAVIKFMQATAMNFGGVEVPNTRLMPLVAEIRQKEALRDSKIISSVAKGGLTQSQSQFLMAMTDISQDEEGKIIQRNITDELQTPIWKFVPPSRVFGDTPDQAYTRIKNKVVDVRNEHYGFDTTGGERLRGLYGKALEQSKAAQLARFRQLIKAWTDNALNGVSTDHRIARGGKIGYVRLFYDELVNTCSYFLSFLDKVRSARNEEMRLAARSREALQRALRSYDNERGKRCFFTFWDDFTHPDAHQAQRNYLSAEQRDIDIRKDDILLDVLSETVKAMQAIGEQVRGDFDNWIAHLATGDPALKIEGLYPFTVDSLDNVNANHELDKRLHRVSEIIGEHEYKADPEFLDEALEHLEWKVETLDNGEMRTTCGVDLSLESSAAPKFTPFRRDGDLPHEYNLTLLLQLTERRYQSLKTDRPLAREVVKKYPTGQKLALAVDKMAEPLYMTSSVPQGPEIVACYIRVHSTLDENTTKYFGEFEKEMKDRNTKIKGSSLTVVDSEDPHKMTIVRSDDLVPSTDFEMWHKCREDYIAQVTDPHKGISAAELHIFPAEINACYYEGEMPVIVQKGYRTLHPEVVALLEDRERFEIFFRAFALGLVRVDDQGQPFWVYQHPDDSSPIYITLPAKTLEGRKEEDIFQVIHNFVLEGRDQRPGNPRSINWEKLREAILLKQRELGKAKTMKRYTQEIEDPKGLVKRILAVVETKRGAVQDEKAKDLVGVEYEDLADLALVVYKKAIQSVE